MHFQMTSSEKKYKLYRVYIIALAICYFSPAAFLHSQNNDLIDSLEISLEFESDPALKIKTLLALAANLENSAPEKALLYAQKAYDAAKKTGNTKEEVNAMNRLAHIYWSITDFKKAMRYAENAKELADKLNMPKALAASYRTTGLIYIELSNYEKSSEYFFKALRLFEQLNDKEGMSQVLSDIGSVNFNQYNYDKALQYYFQSREIAEEMNDRNGIARVLNNIAAVYEAIKDYEKAAKYFLQASEINRELGNRLWEGINYMNLGTIRLNLKDYDMSLSYFEKALSIFTELQSKIMQARCHLNLANFYMETGDSGQSLKYATLALNEGREQGLKQIVHDAADMMQRIYLKKGDIENAYKYVILQYEMKDSLLLMENKTELTKLELQYEFNKREQAKQIEQQHKDRIILMIIISLLVVLIVIILILARLRVKAKNALITQQRLQHELEFKKKELTTNVMSLMKKNEVLSAISDKLISIKNQAVKEETKTMISKISKELRNTIDEEILEEFELRFKEVHTDFYDKLLAKFPRLSPNELRLSAFLRLNMSTKEIAELTGQQPSSLETARYRLRKKLGITNSNISLVAFLQQI